MDKSQIITPEEYREEELSWSLFGVWNKAFEKREERVLKPRSRIWASELGGAYIDRYLKMMGIEPTTPPNTRSKRKWDMGSFLEIFVRVLLKKADIFRKAQEYLVYEYPGLLPVTGRLDFLAGGKPDWDRARRYIDEWAEMTEETPDELTGRVPRWLEISNNFLDALIEKYGDRELKTIIIELKTCSLYMFNLYEQQRKANTHHMLQLYHYIKTKNLPEGHIFYLSKDDGRGIEFGAFNPSPIEDLYREDIEQMTHYYKNNIQPDLERLILFDPNRGIFIKNWKVEYSTYLYHLYGFETPMAYREAVDTKIRRFNGLITRITEEKQLTKTNLETSNIIEEYFPDFDDLVTIVKDLKAKGKLVQDATELAIEKDEALV